jgi:hypothetical protein
MAGGNANRTLPIRSARHARAGLTFCLVLSTLMLGGCVVWKSDYDALKSQNERLQQRLSAS